MFVKLSALTKLSAKQSVHIFSCIKEEKVEINVKYLSKFAGLLEFILWDLRLYYPYLPFGKTILHVMLLKLVS